ncbi:MAG: hypothetical protein F4186_14920, partial [Boseongicola sp. SB0676_bin_33]|nr:hypothetical protein [Boseongicola sp. SB0676_bin_33]
MKPLGNIWEFRVHFGPCYRIFSLKHQRQFVLLCGSDEDSQERDIRRAREVNTPSPEGGFVDQNLGGARTVSDGSIVVDRDMNGARGIMLRALYGNLGRFRAAGDDVALVA